METTISNEIEESSLLKKGKFLALFSIGYNLSCGLISSYFGSEEESLSLFGFGLDSLLEMTSAILVIWCFYGQKTRETIAAKIIGSFYLVLSLGLIMEAYSKIKSFEHPETTTPGMIISIVNIISMWILYNQKKSVANNLGSNALGNDAICSLNCLRLSVIVLLGSSIYFLFPSLWWIDAAATIALAIFIGFEWYGAMSSKQVKSCC